MRRLLAAIAAAAGLFVSISVQAEPSDPKVGVYYFPGWQPVSWNWSKFHSDPWGPIRAFPDKEPLLGYYKGDERAVIQQQADWMQQSHINFMVYDWAFEDGQVRFQQPLAIYRSLTTPKPSLALLWTNHGSSTTQVVWKSILSIWIGDVLQDPNYFRIDGRPVVFIFSARRFAASATAAGTTASSWIAQAQSLAKASGLPPIYFVAGVGDADKAVLNNAGDQGYSAVSAYNFVAPGVVPVTGFPALSHEYEKSWSLFHQDAPDAVSIA